MKIYRHPALLVLLVGVSAIAGCQGTSHKGGKNSAQCRLQVAGRRGGRAVVSFDDATGNPKMSAAITAEVAAWNASSAPVLLAPSTSNPGITFRAVSAKPTVEHCQGTAPRVVTVELNTSSWNAPAGATKAVKDPQGAIAHVIARALGLATNGSCPSLTSSSPCPHRAQTPGPGQIKILQRLYATATPSASP